MIVLFLLLQVKILKTKIPTYPENLSRCSPPNRIALSLSGLQMTTNYYAVLRKHQKTNGDAISRRNPKISVAISSCMPKPRPSERKPLSLEMKSLLFYNMYFCGSVCVMKLWLHSGFVSNFVSLSTWCGRA